MHPHSRFFFLLLVVSIAACSGDEQTASLDDAAEETRSSSEDASSESGSSDTGSPFVDDVADGPSACPQGSVTLTMRVDDSANRTYGEGDLLWTGSFSFDENTNSVTYATAWQPTDGPYPLLFDDGPISEGGHEAEGEVAGDHIFSVAVCYVAEQDRLIAYGVLNDDLRWIWQGPNGLLEVPANASGRLDAEGLVIEEHGDRDVELTLDLNALHPDYATISLETHAIYLKGSMNAWTPVQLLDNGKLGDAVAGDGILTYQHSNYAYGHIGLLRPGQEAQFVFVFAMGDLDPDLAAEYKVEGEAAQAGTAARALCLDGWVDAEVIQSPDSKGITLNTALIVCPDDPDEALASHEESECGPDTPCPPGEACDSGECFVIAREECGESVTCPEGQSCVGGECLEEEPPSCEGVSCPDGELCIEGACVPTPVGECSDQVACPDPHAVCLDGECVTPDSSPELVLVIPATGTTLGGTTVSLQGSGFIDGAKATFGGLDAETVSLSESELVVTTPQGSLGSVDVKIVHPDGASTTYPGGFTYVEAGSAPIITTLTPDSGPSSGGTLVELQGANFAPGAVVRFGTSTAFETVVAPNGTSLTTLTPESPLGVVSVSVENPDGQQGVLENAYTYAPNIPDWGQLYAPENLTTFAGASITLTAEVYEAGVTEAEGAGFGLVAEVGYGPVGTMPNDEAAWVWQEAEFLKDVENNDLWTGNISAPEGEWSATMRFSLGTSEAWHVVDLDGTVNGTDPAQFPTLTFTETPAVAITSLTPPSSWPWGGIEVSVEGIGLAEDCTLSMDETPLQTSWDEGTLSFIAPPGELGDATVTLSCPEGSAEASFAYTTSWDGLVEEWPESTLLGANALPSAWTDANSLRGLYVTSDATHLYVGVDGECQGEDGANAIVVYIDTDFGENSGLTETSAIVDEDHPVDAALGGALTFTAPGFGAEAAFVSLDMASYDPSLGDPALSMAGWRSLSPGDDLPWLIEGAVHSSPTSLEARLPLSSLFGEASGAQRTLAFIARIANGNGDYLADQSIPEGVEGDANQLAPEAVSYTLTY